MNTELFITFVILSTINVILQTIKSLVTNKGGKLAAATMNAVSFGFYTVVLVYTMCDLPLELKALVTAGINFVGVFLVKWAEEKLQKEKLWKIELTVKAVKAEELGEALNSLDIPCSAVDSNDGKYVIYNCYANTCKESAFVKTVAERFEAKYYAGESKTL